MIVKGEYKTMKQAILAHDMEALRLFGLESGSYLNQIYELCPSKEKCQGQVMRFQVKSADGELCWLLLVEALSLVEWFRSSVHRGS